MLAFFDTFFITTVIQLVFFFFKPTPLGCTVPVITNYVKGDLPSYIIQFHPRSNGADPANHVN